MNTKTYLLVILILSFSPHCIFSQSTRPDAKSSAHLKKFNEDYIQSILNEKPEIISGYFAADIRLMPEFQKTINDKNNVSLYYKFFTDTFDTQEFSRSETEILDLGTRILETGLFTARLKLKSENRYVELKGKYVDLWEKKGTEILLLTQAWNYNHSVDFAGQLQFPEIPSTNVALAPHVPINDAISFELAALNEFMETVISERDSGTWAQFYADDAAWFYTGNMIVKGRKSLDAFFEQHAKELPIFEKLDVRNDRIDVSGIYVIEYASHIANIRNGDFSGVFTGKDLVVWRRETNGSLKIFRHIGMYD